MLKDLPSALALVVLERGCPRPTPNIGIGVPFLKHMNDIVPFIVDIRNDNRLIEKWDDIIVLHDNTVGKYPASSYFN